MPTTSAGSCATAPSSCSATPGPRHLHRRPSAAELHRAVLGPAGRRATRRSRRRRPAARRAAGSTCAAPSTPPSRTGGEPLRLPPSAPAERPRRLVLLLDVSGSMEPYARALRALRPRRRDRRAPAGSRSSPSAPGSPASPGPGRPRPRRGPGPAARRRSPTGRAAPAWATRLGDFNDRWGARGMARGAVVVILSDGWDRGDPEVAGRGDGPPATGSPTGSCGSTRCRPSPGYEPLARGMAAALPHVDALRGGPLAGRPGAPGRASLAEHRRTSSAHRAADEGDPRTTSTAGGGRAAGRRWRGSSTSRAPGPATPGAAMAVNEDGEVAGSVSGGCVEGAVVAEPRRSTPASGRPASTAGHARSSRSATATTTPSPSASPAAAPSTCSSSRSTGTGVPRSRCARPARRRPARAPARRRWPPSSTGPGVGPELLVEPDAEPPRARSATPTSTGSWPATRWASWPPAARACATTAPAARPTRPTSPSSSSRSPRRRRC